MIVNGNRIVAGEYNWESNVGSNLISDKRAARGSFEITSTIGLWIVRHEVQLFIYRIKKKIEIY